MQPRSCLTLCILQNTRQYPAFLERSTYLHFESRWLSETASLPGNHKWPDWNREYPVLNLCWLSQTSTRLLSQISFNILSLLVTRLYWVMLLVTMIDRMKEEDGGWQIRSPFQSSQTVISNIAPPLCAYHFEPCTILQWIKINISLFIHTYSINSNNFGMRGKTCITMCLPQ